MAWYSQRWRQVWQGVPQASRRGIHDQRCNTLVAAKAAPQLGDSLAQPRLLASISSHKRNSSLANVGVPKELLHHPKVSATLKQMGGEGVSQHVRADPLWIDPGAGSGLVQHLGEAPGRQPAGLAARGKQPRVGLVALRQEARPYG